MAALPRKAKHVTTSNGKPGLILLVRNCDSVFIPHAKNLARPPVKGVMQIFVAEAPKGSHESLFPECVVKGLTTRRSL